jgi:hypothetical protein
MATDQSSSKKDISVWLSFFKLIFIPLLILAVYKFYEYGHPSFFVLYLPHILFVLTIVLTAFISSFIYKDEGVRMFKIKSPDFYFLFFDLLIPFVIFCLFMYVVLDISDDLLRLITNAPEYLLFPCERVKELSEGQVEEVLDFWKIKFLSDKCGS